ncbi:methyl-accepting chemotaxis protein [Aquabacterium sp.]|uniref:methyl-accepting chemotaxis protein n=1 Tax=Aquabacterium sp. TaxID=1872578 RepID=UPI0037830315
MLSKITVAQRLLFAFGSATLMCAAIATLAVLQMQTLAQQLGTPQALAASRQAAWLIGALAALASAGGVVVSLWIVRGLTAALGAEPQVLGGCARRVADGDLGGPVPTGAPGVMGDLARMQQQLVQLVGAVRTEADAVHARGRQIAEDSGLQQRQASQQAQALGDAAAALQREALGVQRGADATQQAATQAADMRRTAHEAQQVIAGAVQRMQQADAGARHIHEAALLITRLAAQTGVLALNAAAAASRAGSAGAEFGIVAHEVRMLSLRCSEAAGEVRSHIDSAVQQIHEGRGRVEQAGSTMDRIVAASGAVAERLAAVATESQARGQALGALGGAMAVLDRQTREGAARIARSGQAAQAMEQRSARLVQAVSVFRLDANAAPPASAADAMLPTDGFRSPHTPGRRTLQPGRG